jgi:hypothetical protein
MATVAMAGLMLIGTQAFANDTQGSNSMTADHARMKDCMTRMRTKEDGSTHDQMKAACKTELNRGTTGSAVTGTGMSNDSSTTSPPYSTPPKH